jgi:hypothetical protein
LTWLFKRKTSIEKDPNLGPGTGALFDPLRAIWDQLLIFNLNRLWLSILHGIRFREGEQSMSVFRGCLLGVLFILSSQVAVSAWAGCGPPQCVIEPTPQSYCYDRCFDEGHSVPYCDGRCDGFSDRVPLAAVDIIHLNN